jgi:hypothetical protein
MVHDGRIHKTIHCIELVASHLDQFEVEMHRARIVENLHVHRVAEIVLYALRKGIVR